MSDGTMTRMRLLSAFAAGALFDLFAFRDAFSYSDRDWLGSHAISPFWLTLALLLLCSFMLDLDVRRPHPGISPPRHPTGLTATLDSRGLLVPFVILLGLTVAHTAVLVRDLLADPTTHNLLPFEYLIAWFVVGVPAVAGSLLARAVSWMRNRIRAQ